MYEFYFYYTPLKPKLIKDRKNVSIMDYISSKENFFLTSGFKNPGEGGGSLILHLPTLSLFGIRTN